MKPTYNKRETVKITGVNPRTLLSWVQKGLIKPSVHKIGQGQRSEYSYENLVQICLLLEAMDAGISSHIIGPEILFLPIKQIDGWYDIYMSARVAISFDIDSVLHKIDDGIKKL